MIADYLMLWDALQEVELQPGINDRFIWRWSADGTYGAATAYRAFFHGTTGLAGAREVWRACCPPSPQSTILLLVGATKETVDDGMKMKARSSAA